MQKSDFDWHRLSTSTRSSVQRPVEKKLHEKQPIVLISFQAGESFISFVKDVFLLSGCQ